MKSAQYRKWCWQRQKIWSTLRSGLARYVSGWRKLHRRKKTVSIAFSLMNIAIGEYLWSSEYCGVISKSPTVKAVKSKIEAEEEKFDFSILDKVVEEANRLARQ